jgi:hypothetical protein
MAAKSKARPTPTATPYTQEAAPAFVGAKPPGFAANFNKKYTPGAPVVTKPAPVKAKGKK